MLVHLRQGRSYLADLLIVLAVIAAGVHASIPRGYMLGHDGANGRLGIIVCTGAMPVGGDHDGHAAHHEHDHHSHGDHDGDADHGQQPCGFAMAAAAADLPALASVPPVLSAYHPPAPLPQRQTAILSHRPQPPVRAPPYTL